MSTTYDSMRDELREDLEKCLKKAVGLLDGKDVWGYDHMMDGYALEVYLAVEKAVKTIWKINKIKLLKIRILSVVLLAKVEL